jgi:hypothetical protein
MAHTAVWDWTGQMIVFGGLTPGASPVGLWTYAARENIWRQPTASSQPQLRVGHVATWDDARRTMLVVGGVADGGSGLDAAWMYAPDRHAWAEGVIDGEAPASTFGSRAVWDRVGQQLLLIGGWGVARGDLWTLSIPTTETTER